VQTGASCWNTPGAGPYVRGGVESGVGRGAAGGRICLLWSSRLQPSCSVVHRSIGSYALGELETLI
jgi:hypothetical protein